MSEESLFWKIQVKVKTTMIFEHTALLSSKVDGWRSWIASNFQQHKVVENVCV